MKENIQTPSGEVAIVIYDAPLPPKYFRFSKKFLRTLFTVAPIFISLLFLCFLFLGIGSRIKNSPPSASGQAISDENEKIKALQVQIDELTKTNINISNKLSAPPTVSGAEELHLMNIKRPYGMQDLIAQNKVTLGQFEFIQENNKATLKFQIISSVPETKVTGHVIVFMISDSGIMAYPNEANKLLDNGIKFSAGEPFSVSRLRPTNADFLHSPKGENVKFIIYIFNREGDLLLIKETDTFKIGAKS